MKTYTVIGYRTASKLSGARIAVVCNGVSPEDAENKVLQSIPTLVVCGVVAGEHLLVGRYAVLRDNEDRLVEEP